MAFLQMMCFVKLADNVKFMKLVKAYEKLTKALLTMKREMISELKEKYGNKKSTTHK